MTTETPGEKFQKLVDLMARLRAPGGCPWDREQTFDTIKPFLLEETYEVLDAIDARNWNELVDELGDLLLQAVFFSQMASEEKLFRIDEALDAINQKLIRRHPHVFGDQTATTEGDVRRIWSEVKAQEKGGSKEKLLEGVPRSLPALVEAQQISTRAAQAGFDWDNTEQVLAKLHEELGELEAARKGGDREHVEDEVGDLLFVVVNLARKLKVDAEQALRKSNSKFRRRFGYVEEGLAARGKTPQESTVLGDGGALAGSEGARTEGARSPGAVEIVSLTSTEQFQDAVDLQRAIWGFADIELLPVRLFVVATKVGGQALGAYEGDRMIGFCLAIPGLKAVGKSYLHSHMMGVLPAYNNKGIGRMLKLHQRDEALARSIELIEWTFDPLELKNAYFNIERLGAVIRRYVLNQYGTTTSFLHGGLPTDRCIAEWWIESERADAAVNGRPGNRPAIEATVEVPTAIARLRLDDPKQAREIQKAMGERFQKLFGMGLAVIGFDRSEETGTYLLGFWK